MEKDYEFDEGMLVKTIRINDVVVYGRVIARTKDTVTILWRDNSKPETYNREGFGKIQIA